MNTNVEALKDLYVALGGEAEDVQNCTTIVEVLNLLSAKYEGESDASVNADAIENIVAVADNIGFNPSGEKTITQNGTHDVTEYASAIVNVPSNFNKIVGATNVDAENKYGLVFTGLDHQPTQAIALCSEENGTSFNASGTYPELVAYVKSGNKCYLIRAKTADSVAKIDIYGAWDFSYSNGMLTITTQSAYDGRLTTLVSNPDKFVLYYN